MSDREKPNLDAALRRHYRGKSLPAARIDEILGAGARTSSPRSSVYYWLTGVAAVLVVGFTGVYTAMHHSFTQAVYREVAMNHRKQLAVEVAAQQYEQVQSGLGRLDFSVIPNPDAPLATDYALVGGRYCSIQGGLAAQLKLSDPASGESVTLYVTPLTDRLSEVASSQDVVDGVTIRTWRDDERFFALARDWHQ